MKNIDNEERAIRGGSWCLDSGRCRASYRVGYEPGSRLIFLGFRLALSSPQRPLPSSVLPSDEPSMADRGRTGGGT